MLIELDENAITGDIIGGIFDVYNYFGPGLLEVVYQHALADYLRSRAHNVELEKDIPVHFHNSVLPVGFRADMIVDGKVIVELKSVKELSDLHKKQLLSYLRLADKRVGILVNFNTENIKNSYMRIINTKR